MNHSEKSFGKFMLLWSGDFISAIGSGLTSFGLGVYIFQQTGKASLMALITLLAFLPSLLLRTNIENRMQGRAWGLIGLISQLGYVAAYAVSGLLADYFFTPLLLEDGALSGSVGTILGTGPGRGIGLLIVLAGILLCVTSLILYCMKSIRMLENGGAYES